MCVQRLRSEKTNHKLHLTAACDCGYGMTKIAKYMVYVDLISANIYKICK